MERRGSILQPFIIVVVVFLLIFWGVGALNTGNWGWFLPVQPTYQPVRVVIKDQGQVTEYREGDPGFARLSDALNDSLSDFSNASLIPLGLSQQTLQDYDQTGLVVEVFYPRTIRFNSPVRMSNVNQLLIPIEGRHAGNRYVFLGSYGGWLAGAMVMQDDSALTAALRDLGYAE